MPFVLCAQHGLVMRVAHDDAHRVSEHHVLWIIVGKRLWRPHGGPEIIALHPKQQLENMRIHSRVDAAELLPGPVPETGILVIDEETTIADFRLVVMRYPCEEDI